jgi:hypothetical protein
VTKEPVAVLTRQLLLAIAHATRAVRREACELEKDPQFNADNEVGRRLRPAVEQYRQDADMIVGWIKRHSASVGLLEEDLPNV